MPLLATAFSILAAAAGVYYLFGSRTAHGLSGYESQRLNLKRVRLRRIGGGAMLLLGICFFAGSLPQAQQLSPRVFIAIWMTVMALLGVIIILAFIDVRLTYRIYKEQRENRNP